MASPSSQGHRQGSRERGRPAGSQQEPCPCGSSSLSMPTSHVPCWHSGQCLRAGLRGRAVALDRHRGQEVTSPAHILDPRDCDSLAALLQTTTVDQVRLSWSRAVTQWGWAAWQTQGPCQPEQGWEGAGAQKKGSPESSAGCSAQSPLPLPPPVCPHWPGRES